MFMMRLSTLLLLLLLALPAPAQRVRITGTALVPGKPNYWVRVSVNDTIRKFQRLLPTVHIDLKTYPQIPVGTF